VELLSHQECKGKIGTNGISFYHVKQHFKELWARLERHWTQNPASVFDAGL